MEKIKFFKFELIRRVVIGTIFLCILGGLPSVAYSATIALQWNPPTNNVDNSSLVNLASYRLYYGFKSSNYIFRFNTNQPRATLTGLINSSNYYFAVTAVNSNNVESNFSKEYFWNQNAMLDILLSADAITVPEGGAAIFQVKLDSAPVSLTTVTVSRASGDANITVSAGASLVFNASNWNTYQTVTLAAAQDTDQLDNQAVIQCSATGLIAKEVTATEQDNDKAASGGGTIGNTNEGASTDTIWYNGAWINACRFTAASNMEIAVMCAKVTAITGSYKCAIYSADSNRFLRGSIAVGHPTNGWNTFPLTSSLALIKSNAYWLAIWSDDANAKVYGQSGGTLQWAQYNYGTWPDPISLSGSNKFSYSLYAIGYAISPTPNILASADAVTVPEGGAATFQVKLSATPVSPATVTVSRASGDANITVSAGASLVFNASNWNTYQTVTLAAAQDADQLDSQAIIRCSATGLTNKEITATEQDVTPSLEILLGATAVTVPEGGAATFQVKLNATPVSPTTVTVSRASGDANITVSAGASLVFNASNWNTYQTVTLAAAQDADQLDSQAIIRCSATGLTNKEITATEQDVTPSLEILLGATAVTVPEGGAATFQVKLNATPVSPTTVTVSRASGDANITVSAGASLVFNASNWNTYQTVTLAAAQDADQLDSQAIIRCSATGLTNKEITATEQDNDDEAGSDGGTIGNTNGGTSTDTIWFNGPCINVCRFTAASNMEVTVMYAKVTAITGSYKCAIYSADSNRFLRGSIAVSHPTNGWNTFPLTSSLALVKGNPYWLAIWSDDANAKVYGQSGGVIQWAQYNYGTWPNPISLSGGGEFTYSLYAVGKGVTTTEEEATEEEDNGEIENLALVSHGSAITGSNGGDWDALIDGVTNDYDGNGGFGYTYWTNAANAPGSMTLDLKGVYTISSMRLLLWNLDRRYYRYKIEASVDRAIWNTIVDRTTTNRCRDWQDISFSSAIQAQYLRLIGTYNSSNAQFHVVEWEVYGASSALPPPLPIMTSESEDGEIVDSAISETVGGVNLDSPIDVRTSDPEPDTDGWKAVDGDPSTFWQGKAKVRGCWLVLAYEKEVKAQDIQVQWAEGSATNLLILGSADAEQWYELAPLLKQGPVSFEYLWIVLPKGESRTAPKVSEIRVELAK